MLSLVLAVALVAADVDGTWPGFLGAGATPVVAEDLPLQWSSTENVAWKAQLPGHGQSSPVVSQGMVFVTAVTGPLKDNLHVLAFDLVSGKPLWDYTQASSDPVKDSVYVSRAAPTPVVDGQAVYAFFESGDLVSVELAGKLLWKRSLSSDYGKFKNKFGLAGSLVQTKDSLITLVDDEGPSYLICLNKQDGAVRWKTDRKSRTSWSSPSLITVGDKKQVIISSAGSIDGYEPETGERLWTFEEVGGNTAATPLEFAPGMFLVGASAGRDGDNSEAARKSNMALSIEQVEGKFVAKVLWRNEQASVSFGSPMVHAGHAYWVNRQGVVYCIDVATGELRYSQRTKQSCWATPFGVGNRVYLFGKDGTTSVIAAGPKFELLAENPLLPADAPKPDGEKAAAKEETPERQRSVAMFSGPTQYGYAVVGNRILVRTGEALVCLKKP